MQKVFGAVCVWVAGMVGCLVPPAGVAEPAADIARQFHRAVVQIRILDRASEAKTSIGTGFFVSRDGLLMTNYHVVANVIQYPRQYRIDYVTAARQHGQAQIVSVDIVHDLALLATEETPEVVFSLNDYTEPQHGSRVYSLGNPHDLGFTLVEGTYNGLLKDSLYERIHFTGSINPGMSGGPAVTEAGRIIGVNVATAGNQLSFLVPGKFAARLWQHSHRQAHEPEDLDLLIQSQLLANQEQFIEKLLQQPIRTVPIGKYLVPGKFVDFLKCWGDSVRDEENPYRVSYQGCSLEDAIYVSDSQSTGLVSFTHYLISSNRLPRARFFSLYQDYFQRETLGISAGKQDVTRYRCETRFLREKNQDLRAVFCLRGYRRFSGLYDVFFRAATLSNDREGIQTTLMLGGVSYENAERFIRAYLEAFQWRP